MSPSWPSHAAACCWFAISTPAASTGAPFAVYPPIERTVCFPWEYVNGDPTGDGSAHHHFLRHPRPAGGETVEHLRARATDARRAGPVLAPGREQALRRTEEARRARARTGDLGDGRQPSPHRLHDHAQGAAGTPVVGAATRRGPGGRVRG